MASVEIIGLLCAGSTRYHVSGGRASGSDLTRAELAGLLAGLNAPQINLAFAKYGDDLDSKRLLIAHVRCWAAGIAVKQDWQISRGRPTLCNMSALAVFEVVRPNRCNHCKGSRMHHHRSCSVCSGTGYKLLSGRQIADAIGINECNYRRLWRSRYEIIVDYVQRLDAEVCKTLCFADKKFIENIDIAAI